MQGWAATDPPRTAPTASSLLGQLRSHTQFQQLRQPLAAGFPLPPESASNAPPDPRVEVFQHPRCFAEAEVSAPASQIAGQFVDHLLHAHPFRLTCDLPHSLLEPVDRLRRYRAPRFFSGPDKKAESEKLPLLRFGHRTLRLVYLELQLHEAPVGYSYRRPIDSTDPRAGAGGS